MSATTASTALPQARARNNWRPRLVSAEFLKLRKRRGLLISVIALTVVPMIIGYAVLLSIHAANPGKHGPAGGLKNLSGSMDLLSTLSIVAQSLSERRWEQVTSAPAFFASWSSPDGRVSRSSRRESPPASG